MLQLAFAFGWIIAIGMLGAVIHDALTRTEE